MIQGTIRLATVEGGRRQFLAESGTGHALVMDDAEGDTGPKPIELVLLALGGCTAFDVLKSTFPAGTVSGAPKIRAMQIISELEKTRRGCYAGAIGYLGFDGNVDSCIALRCAVLKNGKAYFQAGAGIVADSDPRREYEETLNKARAMTKALAMAVKMGRAASSCF